MGIQTDEERACITGAWQTRAQLSHIALTYEQDTGWILVAPMGLGQMPLRIPQPVNCLRPQEMGAQRKEHLTDRPKAS